MNFNNLKVEDQAIIIKSSRATCRNCLSTQDKKGFYCSLECKEEYLSLNVRIETQKQWSEENKQYILFMELRQIKNHKIVERFAAVDYKKDPKPKDFNQLFKQLKLAWRSINPSTSNVRTRRHNKKD